MYYLSHTKSQIGHRLKKCMARNEAGKDEKIEKIKEIKNQGIKSYR